MFNELSAQIGVPVFIIVLALIWTLVWKALALWKSARLNQPIWFILLFLINTLGIFEILYIFLFSEMKQEKTSKKVKKSRR